jgi:hypothetical protein
LVIAFVSLLLSGANTGLQGDESSALAFTANIWYIFLPVLFLMVLLPSIYFFLNYRLFLLLEREDWPALAYYLEQKIFIKGRYTVGKVRLLASSYLVISDYQSVLKLESKALLAKPSVVSKNVLIFGAARILSGNQPEAAAFFRMHMQKCKAKDKQWVRWFYGFSLLLSGSFSEAEPEFSSLAISSNDALIAGLSAYFLFSSLKKKSQNPDKCLNVSENGKGRVIKALKNLNGWKKETDKMGADIHVAIIKKYISEAGDWLFQNP